LSVFVIFEIVLFVRIADFGGSEGPRGGLLGGFGVGDTDFDDALLSRESAETAFSTLGIDAAGGFVTGVGSFAAFFSAHTNRANSSSILALLGSNLDAASKSFLASATFPKFLRAIALRHNTFALSGRNLRALVQSTSASSNFSNLIFVIARLE